MVLRCAIPQACFHQATAAFVAGTEVSLGGHENINRSRLTLLSQRWCGILRTKARVMKIRAIRAKLPTTVRVGAGVVMLRTTKMKMKTGIWKMKIPRMAKATRTMTIQTVHALETPCLMEARKMKMSVKVMARSTIKKWSITWLMPSGSTARRVRVIDSEALACG